MSETSSNKGNEPKRKSLEEEFQEQYEAEVQRNSTGDGIDVVRVDSRKRIFTVVDDVATLQKEQQEGNESGDYNVEIILHQGIDGKDCTMHGDQQKFVALVRESDNAVRLILFNPSEPGADTHIQAARRFQSDGFALKPHGGAGIFCGPFKEKTEEGAMRYSLPILLERKFRDPSRPVIVNFDSDSCRNHVEFDRPTDEKEALQLQKAITKSIALQYAQWYAQNDAD